ncbi:MAG TPA: hypothetical protein VEV63_17835 [Streptosporangiaceae bacterium]|nr:hypothetical protein [Streptosporangiaceae bacterium]
MEQMWDAGGEAGAALAHVVEGFGVPVLGRPDMLEGLLKDDVPQLPREVAMLTEAARFGVADQLAERIQQGVAANAAIAMVANEMTSRTAVDAAGALWAAGVFARVVGYQVTGPQIAADLQSQDTVLPTPVPVRPAQPAPPVPPVRSMTPAEPTAAPPLPTQADPVPTRVAEDAAPATRRIDAGPVLDGQTIRAERFTVPPPGGYVQTGPPFTPVAPDGNALRVPAALGVSLTVVMLLFSVLLALSHADTTRISTSLLPLTVGGLAIGIWTARGRPGGASFAAVLGVSVPAISYAIYDAAIAAGLTDLSPTKRHVVEATSIVAILAAIIAAWVAVAALRRWRQLGRQRPDGLSVVLTIVGVCFGLANIFGQLRVPGGPLIGNVLGPAVAGWFILWGLVFLVAFALPPVLASFMRPGSPVQLAVWAGWLLIVLSWQISDSPTDGFKAAYGLYLTWLAWLVVAAGTVVLAVRAQKAAQPGQ